MPLSSMKNSQIVERNDASYLQDMVKCKSMERILELEEDIIRLTSYVYNINYDKYKKIIIVFGNGSDHSLYINNQALMINPGEVIGYLGYDFKQKIYPIGENEQMLNIDKPTKGSSLKHKQMYKDYSEDEEIIELIYLG